MTGIARWRAGGLAAVVMTALASVAVGRWAGARIERGFAERSAIATAAYLAFVTPAAPGGGGGGGSDYDLLQLLIQTRALAALPGFADRLEVYHRTASLLHAAAAPLDPAAFEALRRFAAVRWDGGAAWAPLFDRDGWDVVGAVLARPPQGAWVSPWMLAALMLGLVAGALAAAAVGGPPGRQRRTLAWCAGLSVLMGLAAGSDLRAAARRATDRWLGDTRLLIQEAVARVPDARFALRSLGRMAGGAGAGTELVPGDSTGHRAWRHRVNGVPRAAVAVRLGRGRWAELRTLPAETLAVGWVAAILGLALLGPLAAAGAAWGARQAGRPQRRREVVAACAFLAPSALHLALFSFAPILFAVYLSAHGWSPFEPAKPLLGLGNFVRMFHDPLVWTSLRNTVLYGLYVPVTMALALAAALALRGRSWATRAVRTTLFLPSVASVVAVALVWQWMYHADFGVINGALSRARIGPLDWLGDPRTALVAVIMVSVWVQLGYQMTVFHAGLQGIPREYLDAALVDGAGPWQRFWRVTFPLLKPVTLFVLVTGIIGSFQAFTLIYVLTNGGPLHATDVIVYRIYQTAWEFLQFGYAGALSLLLWAVLFGVTWAQLRLLGQRVEYA